MKNSIIHTMGLVSLMLFTSMALAQNSNVKILSMSNPANSNGIQIGDVLNRTFNVKVDSVYQLPKSSLPMKGENRNGIELRDINVQTTRHGDKNVYTIALSYQVFASAAKPVVMALPDEHLALIGGAKALSIDIPAWRFWYSPLVAEGIANAKDNLQPQAKPALIDLKMHHTRLWISLALLVTGLLGLVYVNADKRWLPFMNGAFAQAHRNIKKLKNKQASSKEAFMNMHQAFNKIYGVNVFVTDLDKFLVAHPEFLKLSEEIRKFFDQSNKALFASQQADETKHLQELIMLSKHLRDCERGV
jgi:mxaA protein